MKKIMTIFGTRPEAIKMAPVIQKLSQVDAFRLVVCVTAQHREMLDQVLELFTITPDHDLNIMKDKQDLFDIAQAVLGGLKPVMLAERPDLVLVHGDTSTTLLGALAAYYLQIPVGHVEAGLRTHNRYSPFPEEMNRTLVGPIASFHFAPTETARRNLLAENVSDDRIWVTGNTVIDALVQTVRPEYGFSEALRGIDWDRRILLVTTHRRENLGDRMRSVYLALLDLLDQFEDTTVVFPVHMNPAVRSVAEEVLGAHPRAVLIPPLEYADFANLMARANLVLTDSGGLQEEAPALGKPVLVLRDTTERPEAVEAGTVRLVGTDRNAIVREAGRLLADQAAYDAMARAVNPYGDGHASERIRDILLSNL
ncbi:MAG: non-hydrolyzing UDP-N-acetylglucosamine 2-epimerase [Solirubrobacterales bacterium]